eukprot:365421-Chlamydomonas_euryale.AAC.3
MGGAQLSGPAESHVTEESPEPVQGWLLSSLPDQDRSAAFAQKGAWPSARGRPPASAPPRWGAAAAAAPHQPQGAGHGIAFRIAAPAAAASRQLRCRALILHLVGDSTDVSNPATAPRDGGLTAYHHARALDRLG